MGFGSILGLAALIAAILLGRRFGIHSAVLALAHAPESRFEKSASKPGVVEFRVTPARSSRGAALAILIGLLIFMVPGIWMVGGIPLAIGLVVLPVGARDRKSATIEMTADRLCVDGRSWSIAQLGVPTVRSGSAFDTDDPGQAIHRTSQGELVQGAKSTSVLFTKVLARRVVDRSHRVTVRSRPGSREHVLAGGLTLPCAEALRDELASEIARRSPAIPASD